MKTWIFINPDIEKEYNYGLWLLKNGWHIDRISENGKIWMTED